MTYKRAALVWLSQGARRREFRHIYKPGNLFMTGGRAYLFHIYLTTTNNCSMKLKKSILLIMIICEILLFIFICFSYGN